MFLNKKLMIHRGTKSSRKLSRLKSFTPYITRFVHETISRNFSNRCKYPVWNFSERDIIQICRWNCRTKGKSETISLQQLITFMNEKQRDPRLNEILYPLYDEKRCLEIINDYERDEKIKAESE